MCPRESMGPVALWKALGTRAVPLLAGILGAFWRVSEGKPAWVRESADGGGILGVTHAEASRALTRWERACCRARPFWCRFSTHGNPGVGVAGVGSVKASLSWAGGPSTVLLGPQERRPTDVCVCLHVCVPCSDTTLHQLRLSHFLCLILSALLPAGTFLTSTAPCGVGTPCVVQPVTFRLHSHRCW